MANTHNAELESLNKLAMATLPYTESINELAQLLAQHFKKSEIEKVVQELIAIKEVIPQTFGINSNDFSIAWAVQDSDEQFITGYASQQERAVRVIINSSYPQKDLLYSLSEVSTHEVAHIAHSIHNPDMFVIANDKVKIWQKSLIEGVAEYAAELEGYGASPYRYGSTLLQRQQIAHALIDVLYDPLYQPEHYEFLVGEAEFPHRGRRLGLYIVDQFVRFNKLSVLDLFKVSADEFHEFVETKL